VKPLDTAKIWRATAAFLLGCAVLGVVTAVAFALHSTLEVALLLYIVVILLVSMTGEVVPSIVLALVAAASLTYFFSPPIFSFSVDSPEDVAAIVVFVATGVLVAGVVKRARRLGEAAVLQEARLREAQARAELAHANRVTTTGQLAASISHEVAQPVSASITNANTALRWLAAEPPNLDEAREALNRILRDGKRASDIIVRIRAFVRKEAPRTDRFDLNEMVSEIVALSGTELRRHGISPRTRLADGLPPVTGDRVQLQQVVLNLILNAADAMGEAREESPELLIMTGRDEAGGGRVAVRDTGPGLAPDSLPRLFDAFYTTKPAGMGMGLSICRSIVEAHGGRITAAGNEPRGAVFEFTLPGEREKASAR
jgi:signal transduction histidine kinase